MRRFILCILVLVVTVGSLFTGHAPSGKQKWEQLLRIWEREETQVQKLRRDLARWYNLNLSVEDPDPDYRLAYGEILLGEGGIVGFVRLPDREIYIPISREMTADSFIHQPGTPIPIGNSGGNAVMTYPGQLDLSTGDSVEVWMLGTSENYTVGGPGKGTCTLVCGGMSYVCGRTE